MTTVSVQRFPTGSVIADVPLRLTRRGRIFLLSVCVMIAAVAGLAWAHPVGADEPGARLTSRTVVVMPGDTLWDIAQRVSAAEDPRATIYEIRRLNGLAGADIRVGEELLVPIP